MKIICALILAGIGIAFILIGACGMLSGLNSPHSPKAAQFIHRHDRFKPSLGNALLLGCAAGAALVAIIVLLVCQIAS